MSNCNCGPPTCGCYDNSANTGSPEAFKMSDLTRPISELTRSLQSVLAVAHTLSPFEFFHATTAQPTISPLNPAYSVGDVLVLQKLGASCLWVNRTTQTVIASPEAAHIVPLEGTGITTFVTTVVSSAPYYVTCPQGGFTSVQVTCEESFKVASTPVNLDNPASSVLMRAGESFSKTRFPTEPRISPFYVDPQVAASLRIIYTS